MPPTPDGEPTEVFDGGSFRHFLEDHLDPRHGDAQLLAMAYLAGRGDLMYDLQRGFTGSEHPAVAVARAAEADARLAARYGITESWGVGFSVQEAQSQGPPSEDDVLAMRRRLIERLQKKG